MKTLVVVLSEAEIKRQAAGGAQTLRDPRHPGLRFRFMVCRTRGSWYLISNRSWKKVAGYPQVGVRKLFEILPELQAKLALGQQVDAGGQFATVGELLHWYGDRYAKDRNLSVRRKQSVASLIKVQLLPRVGNLLLSDVSRDVLDERLLWPMQAAHALGYVRQCMRVLQMAFSQADALKLLNSNPMLGIKFSDFVRTRIKPKPARLSMLELPELLQRMVEQFELEPVGTMLALMQLAHGTRLGETRKAQWSHICLTRKLWIIPAENTKTKAEHTLPLTERMCELLTLYRQRMGARAQANGALFVRQLSGAAISDAQAQLAIRKLSGGNWSSHDLRKLARTGWVELGVDYLIGEMLLNHAMGFSAETYVNTSAAELKLDALERWHKLLDGHGLSALSVSKEV